MDSHPRYGGDPLEGYMSVEECAVELGLPVTRIRELVTARVLKAYSTPYDVMVQPALIAGVTCPT